SYYEQGRRAGFFSLTVRPSWRFFKDFIILRGFMDGYYGYTVSMNSALEVFLKYAKLRDLYTRENRIGKETICFINSQGYWGGGEKWHFDIISSMNSHQYRFIYISSHASPLSQKLADLNVDGYQISISNRSFLNPFKVMKLARIFRDEKVGVLLTNLSNDMKVASIAGKLAGVPNIIYRRGTAIPVRNSILNRYFFRRVITRIIANSQETKRSILENNSLLVPEDKIKMIYNGVILSSYHRDVKPLYKAEEGEIVLGSAGRLSEEKGHLYLLDMMNHLKKDKLRYKLLIAGEGKMLHTLEKKVQKLDISDQVKFLGFVEDMPSFFRSIDIFVLSSQFEGFGYVITEAMASRKPVVAFDIKSSAEIVEHGETGYITRSNDIDDMAARVNELAADSELRDKMGEKGRMRVKELFSFEKSQKEVVELFNLQAD
ncbi:MAG: glycosyltransferase, partial [Candidatus Atribacteria bacterium]